jgi:hypothetical protein
MKRTPWAMGIALAMGLALALVSTGPSVAAQPGGWVPAPVDDQQAIVKVMNKEADKNGAQQHGLGCYSFWALKGHKDVVTVSFKTNVSPSACGDTAGFGIQVFRKTGGSWTRVAENTGAVGSSCKWIGKPSAATKRLVTSSGLCR